MRSMVRKPSKTGSGAGAAGGAAGALTPEREKPSSDPETSRYRAMSACNSGSKSGRSAQSDSGASASSRRT